MGKQVRYLRGQSCSWYKSPFALLCLCCSAGAAGWALRGSCPWWVPTCPAAGLGAGAALPWWTRTQLHTQRGETKQPRDARPQPISPNIAWEPPALLYATTVCSLAFAACYCGRDLHRDISSPAGPESERLLQVLVQTLVSNALQPLPSPLP